MSQGYKTLTVIKNPLQLRRMQHCSSVPLSLKKLSLHPYARKCRYNITQNGRHNIIVLFISIFFHVMLYKREKAEEYKTRLVNITMKYIVLI